jgi:[acyl-carrier-protein] S-malonyltransferase
MGIEEVRVRYAMLFPGQGSQAVGMGADLAAAFPAARAVFARADAVLGYALSELCFAGPLETLTETHHAQPALLTHSVAVLRVLELHGVEPAVAAGHSLGEYSALVAARGLDFEAALHIVRRRGELMFASGVTTPGTMAAVVGADPEVVAAACAAASALGVCEIANRNAPDQVVISGAVGAVTDAMARLQAAGVKIVKRLNVSGAFHSALMREPAAALAAYLDEFTFRDAAVPVIANVTAAPVQRGTELRELLKRQIHSPVRWNESMEAMRRLFPGPALELGAGSVLKGLLRRIDRNAECTALGDRGSLEGFLAKSLAVGGGAGAG